MIYRFFCKRCKKDFDVAISINDYAKEKDRQKCPKCGAKLERVIEWTGIATGSGDGWAGNSRGNVI